MASKAVLHRRLKTCSLVILLFFAFIASSCDEDKEIRTKLNSNKPTEIIEGAYKAGDSGDKKYVPLLLSHANNGGVSTALHFKGFSVYTEIMFALERILKVKPPHPYGDILTLPDSVNIQFYYKIWQGINKTK